ncbi:QueT transporter family protein [Xylocopilactobacillus apis]|uniref:Membrane protein n=1 Tax=Xylocopilactobacillus apis TaxID=2932183 RepID=A0AAU9DFZ4_9LACO|nr:QueT transporter family protein [Xylocopilactobacillus apis]BDR55632.1 membrane protein [Xylocopilactobacillus apis]
MSIKNIAKLAVVAALYVVLTNIIPGVEFGPVQFRISEALNFLIFYNYRYIYSLGVGCAVANFLGSPIKLDVLIGTAQTVLVLALIYLITKNMKNVIAKYVTLDVIFSLSMFIIAWEMWLDGIVKKSVLFPTYLGLVLSEAVILTISGIVMYLIQEKKLINLYLD